MKKNNIRVTKLVILEYNEVVKLLKNTYSGIPDHIEIFIKSDDDRILHVSDFPLYVRWTEFED